MLSTGKLMGAGGFSGTVDVTFLLIAGGGGGGNGNATGGGAGGVLHGTIPVVPNTYSVTIGAGGGVGGNGGNSFFTMDGTTFTAYGGGAGATSSGGWGFNGGSGGGGSPAGGGGGSATQTSMGGLIGYGNNGGVGGVHSSADSQTGGGGAGSPAIPNSNENKGSFPVQYGLGGDAITLSGYNVAAGGNAWNIPSWWVNRYLNGISPSQVYRAGSTYTYGDGGAGSGSGRRGRLIIIGTNTKSMSTSGSFTKLTKRLIRGCKKNTRSRSSTRGSLQSKSRTRSGRKRWSSARFSHKSRNH